MASNDYGTVNDLYTRNRARVIAKEILNRIQPVWLGDFGIEVFRNSPADLIDPLAQAVVVERLVIDPEAPDIDLDAEQAAKEQALAADMVESQEPDLTGLNETDQRAVLSFQGDRVQYANDIRLAYEVGKMQADRNADIDAKVRDAKAAKMNKGTPPKEDATG